MRIRISTVVFAAVTLAAAAASADKIERTFKAKCASCHGEDGKGQTTKGKEMGVRDMTAAAWQKDLTDDKIQKSIEDGVDRTEGGKKQQMDPYKDKLKPDQVAELVKYIRGLAAK